MESSDPKDELSEEAVKRVTRAWRCILTKEFHDKSQQNSKENGEGINVFRFLHPSSASDGRNCEYYYADRGCQLWTTIIEGLTNRQDFEKAYQSSKYYVVCVCVPVDHLTTMSSIKMFHYDTHKEFEF